MLEDIKSKYPINENSPTSDQLLVMRKFLSQIKEVKAEFYLLKTENVVNVYSDYVTFETIKDCVLRWFRGSRKKIVAVSNLKNEVIEISLFRDDVLTTTSMFGNVVSYGFPQTSLSVNEINRFIDLQCVEEIQVDELRHVEEIYDYFKNLFNLPIGLSHKEFENEKAKQFNKISFVI